MPCEVRLDLLNDILTNICLSCDVRKQMSEQTARGQGVRQEENSASLQRCPNLVLTRNTPKGKRAESIPSSL